jgi:hypothetical protein
MVYIKGMWVRLVKRTKKVVTKNDALSRPARSLNSCINSIYITVSHRTDGALIHSLFAHEDTDLHQA